MYRRTALALAGAAVASAVPPSSARTRPPTATPRPYRPLGSLSVERAREAVISDDGTTAHVAAMDGFVTVDVSDPASPERLVERRGLLSDREEGPLRGIQDVSVDGDRLLVVGPAHGGPALQAALVFDGSEPASPRRTAVHLTDYPIHNCHLDGGYAYLTGNDGESNPLVVVDVDESGEVARWSIVDRDERWSQVPPVLRVLHDVWVGDGVAVLSYWDAGTVLLDVSDPAAPAFLGRVGQREPADLTGIESPGVEARTLPGNHHYAELDSDGRLLAIGHEAWSVDPSEAPGGIDLWDVSTVTSPRHLARIPPPPTPDPSFGGVWTTAHNFDLQDGRLYSAWYQGGVKIHDVSDPANPRELAWWRRPREARFWTARHAGEFFVASSMARGTTRPALYTFPDRPGKQADPPDVLPSPTPGARTSPSSTAPTSSSSTASIAPSVTATISPTADSPTPTRADVSSTGTHSPTATPTTTGVAGSRSASPTTPPDHPSGGARPTDPSSGPPRSTVTTVAEGQSGFEILAAIAGLGLGALARYVAER